MEWQRELPFVSVLADGLEEGVMIVDDAGKMALVSAPMAAMLGRSQASLMAQSSAEVIAAICASVDQQPELVRQGRLLPGPENPIVHEEFEISRPSRSVIRWVARFVSEPRRAQIVVATDITAQVDLTAAYQRLAMNDGLTGLANRRYAEQTLRREIARAQRYKTQLSVALLDIDHFKRVNDTQGHGKGDDVLIKVADVLRRSIRDSDFVARWGGEEFVLLMGDTDLERAGICCGRIREQVEQSIASAGRPVTISIGIAAHRPGDTLDTAVARADAKLYEAKRKGRNRVEL